ncbi:hypothetical protein ACQEU5_20945 [Marinactinospora thermotolerans]|uniref:Uncharacterized protein n=1 Tax=Marinactinospora thermotolerans DSM 45154 TaxID=1122192 RepID=A0A1T4PM36_9ACTN|nr:hypothetical protein [Marinactinospora thermotolerans]SJZ92326.1 hypothetical protein SAMN02745673_01875 [Marinactinospora thermotolerans DSM 45154]
MKKTLSRILFAGVVAPTLALGAPAVAMADTFYGSSWSYAGPYGAGYSSVYSSTWGWGGWYW